MPEDVVLELDGVPIADDETIPFRDDERLDFTHAIKIKHIGDVLQLKILRQGQVRADSCCGLIGPIMVTGLETESSALISVQTHACKSHKLTTSPCNGFAR